MTTVSFESVTLCSKTISASRMSGGLTRRLHELTFPDNRRLPEVSQSTMRSLGKAVQRLFQALSGRLQYLLSLWILDIAVLVELVATRAEHGRGKQFCCRCYEVGCEVACGWGGEAKLACRWL